MSPALPQIPCITCDSPSCRSPNKPHLESSTSRSKNCTSLWNKMLPDLGTAVAAANTEQNKHLSGTRANSSLKHEALLKYLRGGGFTRTASLGQAQRQNQNQNHINNAKEQAQERKKIFTQRHMTYGGLVNNSPSNKAQAQQETTTTTNQNPNKKKRLSLTSGSFSHQFPRGGGGDAGGLPADPEKGAAGDASARGPAVSDIIGSFGLFQLLVLLFSGLREGLVGYDALIMSVILQPETKFLCADNLLPVGGSGGGGSSSQISSIGEFNHLIQMENYYHQSNLSELTYDATPTPAWNETAQCYRSLDGGRTPLRSPPTPDGQPIECRSWVFANQTAQNGPSLVAEWSLVCQYHWLIAFIESAYFFGLVAGNLTWGYYADRFGRRPAYLLAHTLSLIFGSLAIFMPSIYLFALCRFLAAFGSVGYNIIYSIQVELIGAKHRSFSTTLNHLGWGLGVVCIPLVDRLFDDYRPIIAVAPLLSLAMFPWAYFWLPESSRWLMANGHYERARQELLRAARFNGKLITPKLEKKIWELEQRVRLDKLRTLAEQSTTSQEAKHAYRQIFTSPKLARDTLILAYLAFVGHLFYYLQTINFAYVKNLSTEANFITSGAGEWVSVVVGAILLRFCTRKTCMSLFLAAMGLSFAFQTLIESELLSELNTVPIITTNNGLGTLSSLLLVFIALIVNQEVYPTIVRQTGTSITNTIGELGSTLAPLVIQLSRLVGAWEANVTYTVMCIAGMLLTQFLTRTDDIELPDT